MIFSRIFSLAVVVISTSLLIYVVLYKNELLSNLYVLLQVLCFTTPSSRLSLARLRSSPKNFKFDFELPIRFSQSFFYFFVNSIKAYTLSIVTKYLKQYFTSLFPLLIIQPCFKVRPFICFGLWIDFYIRTPNKSPLLESVSTKIRANITGSSRLQDDLLERFFFQLSLPIRLTVYHK